MDRFWTNLNHAVQESEQISLRETALGDALLLGILHHPLHRCGIRAYDGDDLGSIDHITEADMNQSVHWWIPSFPWVYRRSRRAIRKGAFGAFSPLRG